LKNVFCCGAGLLVQPLAEHFTPCFVANSILRACLGWLMLCCAVLRVCGSSGRGLHMHLAKLRLVCFLLRVLLLSGFLLESSDSNALS
jgi:hypothetical protein